MAQIIINEISRNYAYSAGNGSFCSVALPITACWGPAYEDYSTIPGATKESVLEGTAFSRFPATQDGLEAFTATFRGPSSNYRAAKDYSYQVATTLLSAGYDIDVCRVCAGNHAQGTLTAKKTVTTGEGNEAVTETVTAGTVVLNAKYPGSFGNNLKGEINKVTGRNYWSLVTYIIDSTGKKTAVENIVFVFDFNNSTDTILCINEVTSQFFNIACTVESDDVFFETNANSVVLTGGTDMKPEGTDTVAAIMDNAIALAADRYGDNVSAPTTDYVNELKAIKTAAVPPTVSRALTIRNMEWNYNAVVDVLGILVDKLAYNTKRLIMPGWDDQNFWFLSGKTKSTMILSPIHKKMMDVASASRCMTALLDIPKSLQRSGVWNDTTDSNEGYAQKVARYKDGGSDGLYATHSSLFAPWCQYKFVGMSRNAIASPGFLALMLQVSMIKNQSLQYEWAMPESRRTTVAVGQPDYNIPKSLLDTWQGTDGVGVNIITNIPDLGMTVWGNSTAFDVQPATYNALQNLSTRYLMNAVEDLIYRCGIGITFQYNNQEAYSQFIAGLSPLLDTMKSVGAITAYTITMSKDINALDSVNLNAVVGQVVIWVEGVINSITVDLIALPAGTETV